MVLRSQCENAPMDVPAIPKGALAQRQEVNGLTDIDNVSPLELQYQHPHLATKHSCAPTLSPSRFLGDNHAVTTEVVIFLALG